MFGCRTMMKKGVGQTLTPASTSVGGYKIRGIHDRVGQRKQGIGDDMGVGSGVRFGDSDS